MIKNTLNIDFTVVKDFYNLVGIIYCLAGSIKDIASKIGIDSSLNMLSL